MKWIFTLSFLILLLNCTDNSNNRNGISNPSLPDDIPKVSWNKVDSIDILDFNRDIQKGKMTIDVGVYFPSNLDAKFDKVSLSRLLESLKAAKEIYSPTKVQINLLWVKTGEVDPKYFSIQANEPPGIPETEYANMYKHMKRHPAQLTKETQNAFEHIIEPSPKNDHTIYLVVLQDVFYPFLEVAEGRNWMIKSVRTGGLSFPTYSYCNSIKPAHRGIITITNLSRPDRYRSTVAHEIGHKAMNVSHEYKQTNPGHEIFAEGGLMLYGSGEDIPSGAEGRWHLERLHRSPFVYMFNNDGSKTWNPDYQEGGHYYDPIYKEKVVYFDGKPPIAADW